MHVYVVLYHTISYGSLRVYYIVVDYITLHSEQDATMDAVDIAGAL